MAFMNITLEELLRITWDGVRVVIFDLKKEILFDGLVMEVENHDGLLNKEVVEIETGVRASQNECYNILRVEGVINILDCPVAEFSIWLNLERLEIIYRPEKSTLKNT